MRHTYSLAIDRATDELMSARYGPEFKRYRIACIDRVGDRTAICFKLEGHRELFAKECEEVRRENGVGHLKA